MGLDPLIELVLGLFAFEMGLDPLIELVRLALLLKRDERGGIRQRGHALEERVKKRHDAADERQPQHGVLVADKLQLLDLFDQPVLRAADDGLLFRAAHQDALDQRLAADAGAERAVLSFSFHGFLRRGAGARS